MAAGPAGANVTNENYGFRNQIGGPGTAPGTLRNGSSPGPNGMAVDSAGNVDVVDGTMNRVIKLTASGTVLAHWGSTDPGDCEFLHAWGAAVSLTGCVYVGDPGGRDNINHPEWQTQNHRDMRCAADLTPPVSVVTGLPSGRTNAATVSLSFSGTDPLVADGFTSWAGVVPCPSTASASRGLYAA